jgi:hypothetical protein
MRMTKVLSVPAIVCGCLVSHSKGDDDNVRVWFYAGDTVFSTYTPPGGEPGQTTCTVNGVCVPPTWADVWWVNVSWECGELSLSGGGQASWSDEQQMEFYYYFPVSRGYEYQVTCELYCIEFQPNGTVRYESFPGAMMSFTIPE